MCRFQDLSAFPAIFRVSDSVWVGAQGSGCRLQGSGIPRLTSITSQSYRTPRKYSSIGFSGRRVQGLVRIAQGFLNSEERLTTLPPITRRFLRYAPETHRCSGRNDRDALVRDAARNYSNHTNAHHCAARKTGCKAHGARVVEIGTGVALNSA